MECRGTYRDICQTCQCGVHSLILTMQDFNSLVQERFAPYLCWSDGLFQRLAIGRWRMVSCMHTRKVGSIVRVGGGSVVKHNLSADLLEFDTSAIGAVTKSLTTPLGSISRPSELETRRSRPSIGVMFVLELQDEQRRRGVGGSVMSLDVLARGRGQWNCSTVTFRIDPGGSK